MYNAKPSAVDSQHISRYMNLKGLTKLKLCYTGVMFIVTLKCRFHKAESTAD